MLRSLALATMGTAGLMAAAIAHEVSDPVGLEKPEIQNLMKSALEGADGLEVIVSHVALPPNVTLPRHWHPGEEIAYILQGSVTLLLEGEDEKTLSEGAVGVVPLKKVHTARSGEKGATIIVFRVHEEGQPGRVLVEN